MGQIKTEKNILKISFAPHYQKVKKRKKKKRNGIDERGDVPSMLFGSLSRVRVLLRSPSPVPSIQM